jgi:MGT family glycosyltransferase
VAAFKPQLIKEKNFTFEKFCEGRIQMARILIASTPADGHVNPMGSVVKELINRGHTIWWYTGKKYQSKIEQLGAVFKPIRTAYDYSGMNREQAFPELDGLEGLSALIGCWKYVFIRPAIKQMEDILQLLEEFPADLLICEETCFGMGLVHEKTGIPFAYISSSIYMYSSRDTAPLGLVLPPDSSPFGRIRNGILNFLVDRIALGDLRTYADQTRAQIGLPKLNTGVFECFTQRPNLYLLGTVPSLEYPRSDLYEHAHFVGAFITPPVEPFNPPIWWDELLHSKRPIVHVTQGTISNNLEELLIPTLRALANEDVLVVAATGGPPVESIKLDPLPDNVRVERYIQYYHFMPHVDVMVTNGGFNGMHMAMTNGVPMVMAGTTEDKPEAIARAERAGAGIDLKKHTPSEAEIRKAVKKILQEPRYKQNAQRLQEEFKRYNGPQRAADLIEQLIRTKKPVLSSLVEARE